MPSFSSPDEMLRWVENCENRNFNLDVSSTVAIPYKAALYYAAILGLPDMVERLINEGNDMNVICYYGTPLAAACLYGRRDVVALLLRRGADPNLAGSQVVGCPLAVAIEAGHLSIVKMLLAHEKVAIDCTRAPPKRQCQAETQHATTTQKPNSVRKWLASLLTNLRISQESSGYDVDGNNKRLSPSMKVYSITSIDDDFDSEKLERVAADGMVRIASYSTDTNALAVLNVLLDAGVSPNVDGELSRNALGRASADGNDILVKLLLSRGAKVATAQGFISALEAACFSGTIETAKILIAAGSDVNHRGCNTPLYAAVLRRDRFMVDLLLRNGARADLYNIGSYDNVLQLACINKDYRIARILISAGSDVNRHGGSYGTSLYAACEVWDERLVSLLISKGASPNIQQCGLCDNALQNVCRLGNEVLAHLLLEHGADPNLRGGYYSSTFQAACLSGNEFIVRLLLSKKADIGNKGGFFNNAVEAAIESKNDKIVQIVLECGLSANEKGGDYVYPILQAVDLYHEEESNIRPIALLLDHGANPNLHREGDNEYALRYPTALHLANSEPAADLLLSHGALIDANPTGYGTPLLTNTLYNVRGRYDKVSELLVKHGADVNSWHWTNISPFGVACRTGRLQLAALMLSKGADLEAADIIGRTPLFATISHSEWDAFQFLFESGANASHEDRRGCTGLHYAARVRNPRLVEAILKLGANVDKVDCNGRSPLHWAMASSMKSTKAINILLEAGAKMDLKDNLGKTPLDHQAMFTGSPAVAAGNVSDHVASLKRSEDRLNGVDAETQGNDAPASRPSKSTDSDHESPRDQLLHYCDGCLIQRRFCDRQSWHRCKECLDFDFCPFCIVNKAIIHFEDHEFTTEPKVSFEAPPRPKPNTWQKFTYPCPPLQRKRFRYISGGYVWK